MQRRGFREVRRSKLQEFLRALPREERDKYAPLPDEEIKEYAKWLRAGALRLREATIEKYCQAIRNIPRKWLNPVDFNRYNYKLNLSLSSLKLATLAVGAYFTFIGKPEWRNQLLPVKVHRRRVNYFFTTSEINQVRKVMGESQELMLDILLEVGCRRAVLMGLTPSHLDFKRGILKIPEDMRGNKSKEPWEISLSHKLLSRIEAYVKEHRIPISHPLFTIYYNEEHRGGRGKQLPRFFVNPEDTKGMRPYKDQDDACTKMFEALGRMAGLRTQYPFRPHLIRHSKGTLTYRISKDLVFTQTELQQKDSRAASIYVTMRRPDEPEGLDTEQIRRLQKEYRRVIYSSS